MAKVCDSKKSISAYADNNRNNIQGCKNWDNMFFVQIASERSNLAKLAGAQFVICTSLILMLLFDFHFDIVPIFASLYIISIIQTFKYHRKSVLAPDRHQEHYVLNKPESEQQFCRLCFAFKKGAEQDFYVSAACKSRMSDYQWKLYPNTENHN